MGYEQYASGQPEGKENEDCIRFPSSRYDWYDQNCSAGYTYICEG